MRNKAMDRIIVADMRVWVAAALRDLILIAYPTAHVRAVTLASALLDDYTRYGADLVLLSHTLALVGGHDTLLLLRDTNPAVPVIVYAADAAVGATIAQSATTRFVDNPFHYKQLAALIAEMLSAAQHGNTTRRDASPQPLAQTERNTTAQLTAPGIWPDAKMDVVQAMDHAVALLSAGGHAEEAVAIDRVQPS